ncbi:MAG: glycosyltransferase [Candidatus Acidiferrales bacterium]
MRIPIPGDNPNDQATAPLNILVVHEMLPHPDRHGADVQWMQMLRELRAQGHTVVHVARNGINRERYAVGVEELGIRVLTPDAERMRFLGFDFPVEWTFEELLRGNTFDLAILFHWFWNGISIPEHYMEEIRRVSPKTFVAVLTDDQQGVREMQMASLTRYWADYERSYDFTSREFLVYQRADLVLTISEDDSRAFLRVAPELLMGRMPMIAKVEPEGQPFAARSGLLFLANFDNPANRDAADWMLAEIWPLIRAQLPAAELFLIGNNLPSDLGATQRGVVRVGYVADLDPEFAKCRVALSPVRFGTGIKTKNLSALSHGVPLITTAVGADGMNLRNGETALIADAPQQFAAAAVRAYNDENLWRKLARQGREHITEYFSERRMQEAVECMVQQARTVAPKAYEPDFMWPYLLVEKRFPEVVTSAATAQRLFLRMSGYVSLAEEFLSQHRPADALAQLRYIFSHVRGRVPGSGLYLHAVELMSRCYRELGEGERAAQFAVRVERLLSNGDRAERVSSKSKSGRAIHSQARTPLFSVIIPTYNRRFVLAECLDALARQSLAPEMFEVVVVDDGSSDDTAAFCGTFRPNYSFQYLRQLNAGAGAARRRAVRHARGEYLALFNDDTISSPGLLAEHWKAHQAHPNERQAVLGDFRFPAAAEKRALTRFLIESPFLFPQTKLQAGKYWEYTYLVTCNLSIKREAVLSVDSFDGRFRVAEDSDLGLRLSRKGFCIRYVPEARAIHQHVPFTIADLIRRAGVYGETQLTLLRKHPALLGDGGTFLGMLDEPAAEKWRALILQHKQEVEDLVATLTRIDSLDFAPFLTMKKGEGTVADEITRLFRRAAPDIYWYYYFSGLLRVWEKESVHPSLASLRAAIASSATYI